MDIVSILSGVVIPLIGILANKEWKKFKINNKVNKFRKLIDVSTQINDILSEIKVKYGFNRVAIIDYHNGTESLGGFSFKYATMSYEKTDNHTKDIISEYKNIPCTILSKVLLQLEHNTKGYVVESIRGFDEQATIIHKMFGIDTAHNFRIGQSLVYGCLSCVFTSTQPGNGLLTEEQLLDLKSYCQRIHLIRNK